MLAACTFAGFLVSYWSAGFGTFHHHAPCFPLAGGLCKFYAIAGGKRAVQRQPLLVHYKQPANSHLSMNNYTRLLISWNDKMAAKLTLLYQCNRINREKCTFCDTKSLEHLTNF
jgi:hypothetical protein